MHRDRAGACGVFSLFGESPDKVRAQPRVSCSDPTVTRYMIPSLVPSGVLSVRFSLARSGRGKM